jgi:hypothetical protein
VAIHQEAAGRQADHREVEVVAAVMAVAAAVVGEQVVDGRRQKAEGRRQKAEGRRQRIYCGARSFINLNNREPLPIADSRQTKRKATLLPRWLFLYNELD